MANACLSRTITDCHIGETRRMDDNNKATIIRFCNEDDIDIIFENGKQLTNVNYYDFLNRNLRCPVITDIIDFVTWKSKSGRVI